MYMVDESDFMFGDYDKPPRTQRQRDLFSEGLRIQGRVADYIFHELKEVNAHDKLTANRGETVELTIAISVDYIRQEISVVLRETDDPEHIYQNIRRQLDSMYAEMLKQNEATIEITQNFDENP
jgi:hypothetical protein